MSWISYNRVWLVPYASAVFVVLLEVGVAVLASRPLPAEAHVTLGIFWLYAVGKGTVQHEKQLRRQEELRSVARSLGIPEDQLQDEFAEFMARRDAPEGGTDDR